MATNWPNHKGNNMKRLDTLLFKMMTLSSVMQGVFLLLGCIGLYAVFSRDARKEISEEVDRIVNPMLSEISRNAILNNNAANDLMFLQVQTNLRLNSISLTETDDPNKLKDSSNCYEYSTQVLCDQGQGVYAFLYSIETGQGKFKTLTLTKDVGKAGFRPIVDKIILVAFAAALLTLGLNVFLLLSTRKVITKDVNKLIDAFASKTNHASSFAIKETEYLYSEFKGLLTAVEQSTKASKDLEKDVAISKMTQMLAHDVRKPFSMLKTGLNLLQASAHESHKFTSNLSFLVSEVDRATKSVDGMLTDVMEIGSTSSELIQEPVAPESLIESTLGEICRVYPKSKINFSYNLNHSAMVNVHLKKVSRVFSNIVGNAVQAVNYTGTLWFRTKMSVDFVENRHPRGNPATSENNAAQCFYGSFQSGWRSRARGSQSHRDIRLGQILYLDRLTPADSKPE
jgi:signal transduction histidine kinase